MTAATKPYRFLEPIERAAHPLRLARLDDEQRDPAPRAGWGVHCRHGRLVGYGTKTELVRHHECGLNGCPCPHHTGTAISSLT